MAWQTPKTNWNALDYYNFSDLNRVENNTLEIANLLKANIDSSLTLPTITTNRDYSTIEFASGFNRVESNIESLKIITILGWVPSKTNWKAGDSFSFLDANRMENNLQLLFSNITNIKDSYKYCGTFNCGEGGEIY